MKIHDILNRIPLSKGNYSTICNDVLSNPNLTDSGIRLLLLLLNNDPNEWKINLTYYSKQLGWNRNKQASAVNNLEKNGFLKKEKIRTDNGFEYKYTISEFGNLIPNERIESPIQQNNEIIESKIENNNSKQQIEPKIGNLQITLLPTNDDTIITNKMGKTLKNKLQFNATTYYGILNMVDNIERELGITNEAFGLEIKSKIDNWIEKGELTNERFNEKKMKDFITKFFNDQIIKITPKDETEQRNFQFLIERGVNIDDLVDFTKLKQYFPEIDDGSHALICSNIRKRYGSGIKFRDKEFIDILNLKLLDLCEKN